MVKNVLGSIETRFENAGLRSFVITVKLLRLETASRALFFQHLFLNLFLFPIEQEKFGTYSVRKDEGV